MTAIVLDLLVVALVVAAGWRWLRRLRVGPLVVAVVVLGGLTAVFDTLMIRVGLYVFAPGKILGWYVLGAPVEDFTYALVAALGMPVLWTVLGRRDRLAGAYDGSAQDGGACDGGVLDTGTQDGGTQDGGDPL